VSENPLDWVVGEFVRSTPGVVNALVVSGDGLKLATSPGMSRELADQLAAASSGLISLARGTAHLLAAGSVAQTILEMDSGYLFITAIGDGAALTVHADRQCDIGMIGYEMTMLASRVVHVLSPGVREHAADASR
jgi:uncharacterized protein